MSAVAFDTLKLARALRDNAKFTPEQAEGAAAAISDAMQTDLATKADLTLLATKEDLKQFATKDDLKLFATKDDLKLFATKDDLKQFATKDDLKLFATKDDLKLFATKDDLKNFPTKHDLSEMKYEIIRLFMGMMGFQTLVVTACLFGLLRYFVHP